MFSNAPLSPNKAANRFSRWLLAKIGKPKSLLVLYLAAIPLAFVSSWIASALYVFGALLWLIPDPRIEKALKKRGPDP